MIDCSNGKDKFTEILRLNQESCVKPQSLNNNLSENKLVFQK